MKYYIIAGEASGDLHASNLMKEIKKKDAAAVFRGCGGDLMKEQGLDVFMHYKTMDYMGFAEVFAHLRKILQNLKECKKDILHFKPDVIILLDYPGFNMRIACFTKQESILTFYYISPQIWAWKRKRVHKIKRDVDRMFVVLPFVKDFYANYDYAVDYVGHPLLDAVQSYKEEPTKINSIKEKDKLVLLLPGSRKQEVSRILPIMCKMTASFPDVQFVVGGVSSLGESFYAPYLQEYQIPVLFSQTYSLLSQADAAVVTSGTASLETALFAVPQFVCYKTSFLSYHIAKALVGNRIKYISLPNLIMDKELVKEMIQSDLNLKKMKDELQRILYDEKKRAAILSDYSILAEKLGGRGASERTANLMWNYLNNDVL